MSAEDYIDFDSLFDDCDDDDAFPRSFRSRRISVPDVTCRRCGAGALTWQSDEDGWHLRTCGGYVHECPVEKLHARALDDFDVV